MREIDYTSLKLSIEDLRALGLGLAQRFVGQLYNDDSGEVVQIGFSKGVNFGSIATVSSVDGWLVWSRSSNTFRWREPTDQEMVFLGMLAFPRVLEKNEITE